MTKRGTLIVLFSFRMAYLEFTPPSELVLYLCCPVERSMRPDGHRTELTDLTFSLLSW